MQGAKALAKGQMLCRRQVLVSKEDHLMFRQSAADFFELRRRQFLVELDALDFGAQHGRESTQAQRAVAVG